MTNYRLIAYAEYMIAYWILLNSVNYGNKNDLLSKKPFRSRLWSKTLHLSAIFHYPRFETSIFLKMFAKFVELRVNIWKLNCWTKIIDLSVQTKIKVIVRDNGEDKQIIILLSSIWLEDFSGKPSWTSWGNLYSALYIVIESWITVTQDVFKLEMISFYFIANFAQGL